MDITWIPYSNTKEFWKEVEILFRHTQRGEGYGLADIYHFIEAIILVYGKVYSRLYATPIEEIVEKIYDKNHSFFCQNFTQGIHDFSKYFSDSELMNFLKDFQVPNID